MANKLMKTLTMGGNTYEIADEYARDAINNIKSNVKKEVNVTLLASGWIGDSAPYTYAVTIADHLNTSDIVDIMVGDDMTTDQILALQGANIVRATWSDNTTLILYAYGDKPEIDAPIKIYINSTSIEKFF